MIFLITGSAGFTGKKLVQNLLKNKKNFIYALDIKKIKIKHQNLIEYNIDLRKKNKLNSVFRKIKKIDYVIHTMALQPTSLDMELTNFIDANFLTSTYLLENLKNYNIKRLVVCSSFSVYGKPSTLPIYENSKTMPTNNYGFSKLLMEKAFEYFSNINNMNVVVLRFDGIYGPNQSLPGFINMAIKTMKKNEDLVIFNRGAQLRNQIYIDDVIKSIQLSLKANLKENYNIFNIAGEKPISNKNLSHKLRNILKSKSNIILSNQGNPLRNYNIYMSISKSKKLIKYKPDSIENNLRKMLKEI